MSSLKERNTKKYIDLKEYLQEILSLLENLYTLHKFSDARFSYFICIIEKRRPLYLQAYR